EAYQSDHSVYYPGHDYFGPITPDVLRYLDGEPKADIPSQYSMAYDDMGPFYADWMIDPFNETHGSSIRSGLKYMGDKGTWARIRGTDYTYCTNGFSWVLISYGPDRDLDATPDLLYRVLKS